MTVFTIGHSTRSIEDFIAALKAAGVGMLADIRRFPKSRRFPHFNGESGRRWKRWASAIAISPSSAVGAASARWAAVTQHAVAGEAVPQLRRLCRDAGIPRRFRQAHRADAREHGRDHVCRGRVVAAPSPHRRRLFARGGIPGRTHLRREETRAGGADAGRSRAATARFFTRPSSVSCSSCDASALTNYVIASVAKQSRDRVRFPDCFASLRNDTEKRGVKRRRPGCGGGRSSRSR